MKLDLTYAWYLLPNLAWSNYDKDSFVSFFFKRRYKEQRMKCSRYVSASSVCPASSTNCIKLFITRAETQGYVSYSVGSDNRKTARFFVSFFTEFRVFFYERSRDESSRSSRDVRARRIVSCRDALFKETERWKFLRGNSFGKSGAEQR